MTAWQIYDHVREDIVRGKARLDGSYVVDLPDGKRHKCKIEVRGTSLFMKPKIPTIKTKKNKFDVVLRRNDYRVGYVSVDEPLADSITLKFDGRRPVFTLV